MKIKKVIRVFEKLIPLYKLAIEDRLKIYQYHLDLGLCFASDMLYNIDVSCLFSIDKDGYYQHYTDDGYLFPSYYRTRDIEISIKPRLKFLKEEVISLKKLLKKGYTDI